jgi:hypothetical protein
MEFAERGFQPGGVCVLGVICQCGIMSIYQHVNMSRCQCFIMSICQYVKMSRCRGVRITSSRFRVITPHVITPHASRHQASRCTPHVIRPHAARLTSLRRTPHVITPHVITPHASRRTPHVIRPHAARLTSSGFMLRHVMLSGSARQPQQQRLRSQPHNTVRAHSLSEASLLSIQQGFRRASSVPHDPSDLHGFTFPRLTLNGSHPHGFAHQSKVLV